MKDRVRVKSIAVDNISCFENLTINFDPDFNIIFGTNGVGKTTILNVIASFFVQGQDIKNLRRRARSESSVKFPPRRNPCCDYWRC